MVLVLALAHVCIWFTRLLQNTFAGYAFTRLGSAAPALRFTRLYTRLRALPTTHYLRTIVRFTHTFTVHYLRLCKAEEGEIEERT